MLGGMEEDRMILHPATSPKNFNVGSAFRIRDYTSNFSWSRAEHSITDEARTLWTPYT